MNNYVSEGKRIYFTNTGSAISAGDLVRVGNRYGVAEVDIAATTGTGTVLMEGVFTVTKTSGTAYSIGDELYWDVSPGATTKTPGTDNFLGVCVEAAASGATSTKVFISPAMQMGRAANVAVIGSVAALSAVSTGGTPDCDAAAVNAVFDEVDTKLQANATKIDAIIGALINAGIMTPAS